MAVETRFVLILFWFQSPIHSELPVWDCCFLTHSIMWPMIFAFARRYVPIIMFPVAVAIGVVGYTLENRILGERRTPSQRKSIEQLRQERIVSELSSSDPASVESLREHEYKPGFVFTKNVSPSLKDEKQ